MFTSKNFSFNKPGLIAGFAMPEPMAAPQFAGVRAWLQRVMKLLGRRHVAGGALEHLACLPLTAQPSLVLVRWGQETLLLGATAQNIRLLAKSPSDAPNVTPLFASSPESEEAARQ